MAAIYFKDPEPGSLSDINQIKTLICYLLQEAGQPLSEDQMNTVFQTHHLVNYFNFNQALTELLRSNHLEPYTDNFGSKKLALTGIGIETANTLADALPISVRDRVSGTIKKILKEESDSRGRKISIEKNESGYYVHLSMTDLQDELINLKLFSPNKEQSDKLASELKEKSLLIYETILGILLNDIKPLQKAENEIQERKIWQDAYEK